MNQADFQALSVFARVAQEQSFSAAARALGIPVTSVSYTVRKIEERLGARLLNRTTRSVSLTEAGARFLTRIAPLLQELELAMHDVSGASSRSMGTLRLNVPHSAIPLVIQPVLKDFLDAYPDINVDVIADNSLVDIVGRGFDAGIRYDNVLDEDMVVVPLVTQMRFCVAASARYLQSRPKPRHPRDLLAHECVNYRSADSGALYRWEFEKAGEKLRMAVTGRIATNDNGLLLQSALDGFGFTYIQHRIAEPHLQAGRLVSVLDGWIPRTGLYLYYYNRTGMPKKLRVFIDFAKAALGDSSS
ncbi:LysR family transcriptional regulator [Cupriavidus sp. 2TAF22]|uniref:LysR family transcriptional regulator n=1 Tax=unclassified Cupriavidus TaxID=2640874 RepID=UPI003F9129D3